MNNDYNVLKKYYGEKFAQLCRDLFPTLLEQEGLLSNLILSKFAPNHHLYDDIIEDRNEENFKNYIYCFVDVEKKEIKINKSVKELLNDAGYNFYECKSEEDIQSFKKYYAKGEELCTFNGERLNRCHVFWVVKKDVDQIKREDFKHPAREDEYGTSVMSIQFTKEGHTLSIKNRYNHRVNNPDATFSNNLDNIIPGLTNAFEREYGFNINQNQINYFELNYYTLADDGRWYKYTFEMNYIYYCPDNIIIDNGQVKRYDKSRYLIIDYFIIDMKEKTIKLFDNSINDCFPDSFINIKKINILKTKEGKKVVIKATGKEDVIITIDELNRIVSVDDKNIKEIKDFYLFFCNLKEVNLPNLEKVGDNFLDFNEELLKLDLPSLKKAGYYFLSENNCLEEINLPCLKKVGDCFLYGNNNIKKLNLPSLKTVGTYFLHSNNQIEEINLPSLKRAGNYFLTESCNLKEIKLPSLKYVGNNFLPRNIELKEIYLPSLKEVGERFLYHNKSLKTLDFPSLNIISNDFIPFNTEAKTIYFPELKTVGNHFLANSEIEEINLPNLEKVGKYFISNNKKLTKLFLPKLRIINYGFLEYNKVLEEVNIPNLRETYLSLIDNKKILSIINQQKQEDNNNKKNIKILQKNN